MVRSIINKRRTIQNLEVTSPLMYAIQDWSWKYGKDSEYMNPDKLDDAGVFIFSNHIERYEDHKLSCNGCTEDLLLRELDKMDSRLDERTSYTNENKDSKNPGPELGYIGRRNVHKLWGENTIDFFYPRGDEIYTGDYIYTRNGVSIPVLKIEVYLLLRDKKDFSNDEIRCYFGISGTAFKTFLKIKDDTFKELDKLRELSDEDGPSVGLVRINTSGVIRLYNQKIDEERKKARKQAEKSIFAKGRLNI